jgi:FkbM family methyltransferase
MKSKLAAGLLLLALGIGAWVAWDTPFALAARHTVQTRLRPLAMVTTIPVYGVGEIPLFLNPADHSLTPTLWAGDLWEATETHWFVRSLRPGDVVVDVGANIGYYTVLAGHLVGESGRVYAFEPDPISFEYLSKNVRLNGLRNVVLEQKAVSNESGTIRLYLADENKGDHRIYDPKGEQRPSVEVEAVALDDYFAGVEDSVDFVKVDTQGAELVILKGMMDLVRRSPSAILAFEYAPKLLTGFGSSPRELVDGFLELELEMFDLGTGGSTLRPVRPVKVAQLRRLSPKHWLFTNLLLVKNRPDVLAMLAAQPKR